MDKVSERCMVESMRNTMLKHEQIFKQQVLELHQLYQVQQMLMMELKGEEVMVKTSVGTSNPQMNTIDKIQGIKSNSNAELSSASLELIKCSKPLRTSKEFVPQQHIEEESIESCSNDECNLDLSLGIGCASEKMRRGVRKEMMKRTTQFPSSNLIREADVMDLKESSNSSGGFGAESLKRPQWLFQALSLNRT